MPRNFLRADLEGVHQTSGAAKNTEALDQEFSLQASARINFLLTTLSSLPLPKMRQP